MAKPDPALLDPARYPVRYEVTTRFADMDRNEHLNNVAIAALFEDARVRFGHVGALLELLREHGAMVASVAIDYVDQAFFPDPVESFTGLEKLGRTSWTVVQILSQHDRVFAFARSTVVCIRDGRPSPLPEAFRTGMSALLLRDA